MHDDVYYVTFFGNSWVDTGTAEQYFHRRAKEMCTEKGFSRYRVSEQKDASQLTGVISSTGFASMEKPVYGAQVECLK